MSAEKSLVGKMAEGVPDKSIRCRRLPALASISKGAEMARYCVGVEQGADANSAILIRPVREEYLAEELPISLDLQAVVCAAERAVGGAALGPCSVVTSLLQGNLLAVCRRYGCGDRRGWYSKAKSGRNSGRKCVDTFHLVLLSPNDSPWRFSLS